MELEGLELAEVSCFLQMEIVQMGLLRCKSFAKRPLAELFLCVPFVAKSISDSAKARSSRKN